MNKYMYEMSDNSFLKVYTLGSVILKPDFKHKIKG